MHTAIVMELGVNGLGVVRSLGIHGVDVIGIYTADGPGVYSKYCRAVKFPPIDEEGAFYDALVRLCAQEKIPPILFPTHDQAVDFISRYREPLANVAKFRLPAKATLDKILTKSGTRELAVQYGVNVPATYTPHTLEEVSQLGSSIQYPCILKSNDFTLHVPDGAKCVEFQHRQELLDFFTTHGEFLGRAVVQERILSGDGFSFTCAVYFDEQSQPYTVFTAKKVHQYPPNFGIMCYGESVVVPEIQQTALSFLAQIGYVGIADIDFLQDRRTGAYFLLEINPRPYYYNWFSTVCGVNTAYLAYLDMVGELRPDLRFQPQKEGVTWIDFRNDLGSSWRKYTRREISIGAWLHALVRAKSYAIFNWRDLKPFLYSTLTLFKICVEKLRGHL